MVGEDSSKTLTEKWPIEWFGWGGGGLTVSHSNPEISVWMIRGAHDRKES